MEMDIKLGFIGAGNMAGAIFEGLIRSELIPGASLSVSNRHEEKLKRYQQAGAFVSTENRAVAERSDIIILAVKPQSFEEVLTELAPSMVGKCLVSIAPGFSTAYLSGRLPGCHVVRAMPNTPLLVGMGVTVVAQAPTVPAELFRSVVEIFSAAGEVAVLPEEQMNGAIAVSGSSPAYFFRMAAAMVAGAEDQGMDGAQALRLAAHTMEGAARMLLSSGKTARELTDQVCSPGGTTLAALTAFDDYGFEEMISQAMLRCAKRSVELGK